MGCEKIFAMKDKLPIVYHAEQNDHKTIVNMINNIGI